MVEPRCIGIDFGTDSVRVVLIRADTGSQEGRAVVTIPGGAKGATATRRPTGSASIRWTTPRAWSAPAANCPRR